ncbi:MAG TPA: hypothetical protein VFK06_17825 [Candidatus Angelobacter sp.]|nr:hypothetical protein [Candidatus Angelobacter sp.]
MSDTTEFSDERFMSAAEKKNVLRAWIRFLKSKCARSQFTEPLYHHLVQHCSFIAHFDRHGFYSFYFDRITPALFRLLDQFDVRLPGSSAEYGSTYWLSDSATGADLNRAMREAAAPYLAGLRLGFEEMGRQSDISAATLVLARYGLTVAPATISQPVGDATVDTNRRGHSGQPIQPLLFGD